MGDWHPSGTKALKEHVKGFKKSLVSSAQVVAYRSGGENGAITDQHVNEAFFNLRRPPESSVAAERVVAVLHLVFGGVIGAALQELITWMRGDRASIAEPLLATGAMVVAIIGALASAAFVNLIQSKRKHGKHVDKAQAS